LLLKLLTNKGLRHIMKKRNELLIDNMFVKNI
jgi:hypothetical protein